jgi:hypothetical protein
MKDKKHFADINLDPEKPIRCVINNYYSNKTIHGIICGRSLMENPKFDVRTDEGEILLNIDGKYIFPEEILGKMMEEKDEIVSTDDEV